MYDVTHLITQIKLLKQNKIKKTWFCTMLTGVERRDGGEKKRRGGGGFM